jgi:hypothetical protein
LRCLVYVDLNMVRAGVVAHPSKWPHAGYNEIQCPKRKNVIIAYDRLGRWLDSRIMKLSRRLIANGFKGR